MDKKPNPFKGYTMEEIAKAEADHFVIVLNGDFFIYNDRYTFSKETADTLYETLLNGFKEIVETGSEKEIEEVKHIMMEFRIYPLRIH